MSKSVKKSSYKKMQELLKKFEKSEKLVNELFDFSKEKKIISSNAYIYHENQAQLSLGNNEEEQYMISGKFYEAIPALKVDSDSNVTCYYMFEAPKENGVKKTSVVFFNIEVVQEGQREKYMQVYFVKKQDTNKPGFMLSCDGDIVSIVMIM